MTDPGSTQIEYYDARADEYDATTYGDPAAGDRLARVLHDLAPRGRTLELACGTGRWTVVMAARVESVLAVDASPRALAVATGRTQELDHVRFVLGDLRTWTPSDGTSFDTVFMAFWLSHVPRASWPGFLDRVSGWLAPAGRILIVDEHPRGDGKEQWRGSVEDGVAIRHVLSGRRYEIVKVFLDPDDVVACAAGVGLSAQVAVDGEWVLVTIGR